MKKSTVCLIILIIMFASSFSVFATDVPQRYVTPFSEDERAEKIEEYSKLIVPTNHSCAAAISSFDVSSNGDIAVCDDFILFKYIDVYNSDGVFKYGYRCFFNSMCCVDFVDDELQIFVSRKNVFITLKDGDVADVQWVDTEHPIENNDYFNHHLAAKTKEAGNARYKMSWWIPVTSEFAVLEKQEQDGTTTVFIDYRSRAFLRYSLIILILSVLFALSAIWCIKKLKKKYSRKAD